MPTPAELEQLSRLASGDLTPEEATAMEEQVRRRPELARALEAFARLDAAAAGLEVDLPGPEASRWVDRVLGPERRRPVQPWRALGVAAALLVGVGLTWLGLTRARHGDTTRLVVVEGTVLVNGLPGPAELPSVALVETGAESTATLAFEGSRLILGPQTRVLARRLTSGAPIELQAGVVYIDSAGEMEVRAPQVAVTVRGRAALFAEPADQLARVTARLTLQSEVEEAQVRARLRRVAVPVVVGSVLVAGLTVFWGDAVASPEGEARVKVEAPGQWQARQALVAAPVPDLAARLTAAEAEVVRLRAERDAARQRVEALTVASASRAAVLPAVRGSLVDALGRPVGEATVTFVSGWHASEPVVSDVEGRFSVEGPPGPGVLYAHKDGRSVLVRDVEPGTNVALKLTEPGTLRGTVTVGGQPVTSPYSLWTSPAGLTAQLPGLSGGLKTFAGAFELERPAGEVWLHVVTDTEPTLAGHLLARVQPGLVTDVTIELAPASGRVRGRVVDETTGKGLKHCEVALLAPDGSTEARYPPGAPEFAFGGRSPGERLVQVDCEGYASARVKAVVDSSQTSEVGDVKLRRRSP